MPQEPAANRVGLVLSGGGARASFQLGALQYLYDRLRIAPDVITGTSAGSIIGAVLAQHADHDGQRAALGRLDELWRGMTDSSDMFTELPWFTRLRERGPVWLDAFGRRHRRQGTLGRSFKRVADLRHGIATATGRVAAAVSQEASASSSATPPEAAEAGPEAVGGEVPAAPPTRTEGPAAARTGDSAEKTAGEDQIRTPTKLLEAIELVRTMGRAPDDLEQIVGGVQRERSMFRPGPLVERLIEPDFFDPAVVAASGVELRIAAVALESGELRYVTESGVLVDRENRPLVDELTVDLVQAVRASCAIPTVFPPVRLGGENYVDGGTRESLPVEIALDQLGVDRCYAVVAGPSTGVPTEQSYDDKDMLAIVMRTTTAIMTDEIQRDEVVRARARGAVVIEPEFDVHDTLTVEPGLIAIAIDYGYLRAAEAHEGASAEDCARTAELIKLRREIWRTEEDLFGDGAQVSEERRIEQITEIAGRKLKLRDLLRQVPASRQPPGAEGWWRGWETHGFDVPVQPSWPAG